MVQGSGPACLAKESVISALNTTVISAEAQTMSTYHRCLLCHRVLSSCGHPHRLVACCLQVSRSSGMLQLVGTSGSASACTCQPAAASLSAQPCQASTGCQACVIPPAPQACAELDSSR